MPDSRLPLWLVEPDWLVAAARSAGLQMAAQCGLVVLSEAPKLPLVVHPAAGNTAELFMPRLPCDTDGITVHHCTSLASPTLYERDSVHEALPARTVLYQ